MLLVHRETTPGNFGYGNFNSGTHIHYIFTVKKIQIIIRQ